MLESRLHARERRKKNAQPLHVFPQGTSAPPATETVTLGSGYTVIQDPAQIPSANWPSLLRDEDATILYYTILYYTILYYTIFSLSHSPSTVTVYLLLYSFSHPQHMKNAVPWQFLRIKLFDTENATDDIDFCKNPIGLPHDFNCLIVRKRFCMEKTGACSCRLQEEFGIEPRLTSCET